MTSSILKVIGCLFLVCLSVSAQNQVKKISTGSISGKVTLKGNGAPGIIVGARSLQPGPQKPAIVAVTDQQGNYRMSNVPPGEYEVVPAAQQFVLPNRHSIKRLILVEGESFDGIDFTLIRGGVITGKVTDEEGRPIVDEYIDVIGPEGPNGEMMTRLTFMHQPTDDRGVYRVYGLPPGKYKIAAGISEDRMSFGRRRVYVQTFHPSTTESAKATTIEVSEGSEATNVDIVLRRTQAVFTVTARVVNGDTGQPIPNARYALQKHRENGGSSTSGFATNGLGELRIENVTPGKYALYLEPSNSKSVYAEPLQFEVVDQDVKDLVLKTSAANSLSGVVVFEGVDEKAGLRLNELIVFAFIQNPEISSGAGGGHSPNGMVNADGTFTLTGLRPGVIAQFGVWVRGRNTNAAYEITRVERDGVVQSNIEIKPHENIRGLRLIVRFNTGSIRGVVKVENGTQSSARMQVYIRKVGDDKFGRPAELDEHGRFITQGLAAGVYEVTVVAYPQRYYGRPPSTKQQVVVNDNQTSEVMLTLNLKTDTGQGGP